MHGRPDAAIARIGGPLPAEAVPLLEADAVVRSLSVAMHSDRRLVLPLLQLKEFDQYTTTHSLNVAVLSMALAEALGCRTPEVRAIGVAETPNA